MTVTPFFDHSTASDRVSEADAGFAGCVGGHFAECDKAVQRGDVDDAAVAALEHVLAEDLAGAQSSGEVGVENACPLLFGQVERGRALDFSGAVDEDVDLAELLDAWRRAALRAKRDRRRRRLDEGFCGRAASMASAVHPPAAGGARVATTSAPASARPRD